MDDNYIKTLTETEARSKSNQHRIDSLEGKMDALNSLATSVAQMVVEQKHMTEELKSLKLDIKALEKAPSLRWNKLVDAAIAAIVAAFVAYILHGGM